MSHNMWNSRAVNGLLINNMSHLWTHRSFLTGIQTIDNPINNEETLDKTRVIRAVIIGFLMFSRYTLGFPYLWLDTYYS